MNRDHIYDDIKKQFPEVLSECFGNITVASKRLNISRECIYRWGRDDPEFEEKICEAKISGRERLKDYAESLHVKHMETNPGSTMFTLKCLAKDRGWIEKEDPTINIVHTPSKTDEEIIAEYIAKVTPK